MEFRHIRYFIAVAEELNFTRAAHQLSTAQPSLSQQIRDLENEIGAPLFQRTQRKVVLTRAGRALLKEAREIQRRVRRLAELAHHATNAEGLVLSVGVNPLGEARVLPRMVPIIKKRFPQLAITFHSLPMAEQISGLRNSLIDIGFVCGPFHEPEIVSEELLKEKVVVALRDNHPASRARWVSLEMLKGCPWIGIAGSTPAQVRDPLVALYRRTGNHADWNHEANSIPGALNMVAMGLGYAFIPEFGAALAPKGVVTRPLRVDPAPTLSLVAVRREHDSLSSLAAFRSVMTECFRTAAANGLP
jgi:LysR family transcriptional regulator, hca operon transcriptional activator